MSLDGAYATKNIALTNGNYRLDVRIDLESSPARVSGEVYNSPHPLSDKISVRLPHLWYSFNEVFNGQVEKINDQDTIKLALPLENDWPYSELTVINAGKTTVVVVFSGAGDDLEDLIFFAELQFRGKNKRCFRELHLEVDWVKGSEPPGSHTHGERDLNVVNVLEEAGVLVHFNKKQRIGGEMILPDQADQGWTAAELLGVLKSADSGLGTSNLNQRTPDWYLYLLVASHYQHSHGGLDKGVNGFMFEKYRRGAAVFYRTLDEHDDDEALSRAFLRTTVHEIGHAFNLEHISGGINTFMHQLPHDQSAFWDNFNFVFNNQQHVWIRHQYIRNVIMGAAPFQGWSSSDMRSRWDAADLAGRPTHHEGLVCKLRFKPDRSSNKSNSAVILRFGEPVRVELKLHSYYPDSRYVHANLDPQTHHTIFYIKRPRGEFERFQPIGFAETLDSLSQELHPEYPSSWFDVDLTYGARGFTFLEPGPYEVVAVYDDNGAYIRSQPLKFWVSYPQPHEESQLVPLLEEHIGEGIAVGGGVAIIKEVEKRLPFDKIVRGQLPAEKIDDEINSTLWPKHPLLDFLLEAAVKTLWSGFKSVHPEKKKISYQESPRQKAKARTLLEYLLNLNGSYDGLFKPPGCLGNIGISNLGWMLHQCLPRDDPKSSKKRKALAMKLTNRVEHQKMEKWAQDIYAKAIDSDSLPFV